MPFKSHDRQYDIVVFGATGYTGLYTAEHIATHLPTNLKWAIAGRSKDKLEKAAAELHKLNTDRPPVSIEVCNLNKDDLESLAKKTFILITTVGPYGSYGEHAFKACVDHGTHYLDCTGEVPWVLRMIQKYENAAKSSGALMFPQIGIESAPPDLMAWALATLNRSELKANTQDVTVSIHRLNSSPSGGTLATVFTLFENFSLKEVKASHVPFALSPIPHPERTAAERSFFSKFTGLVNIPNLGLLTSSIAGMTDAAIIERTWGLLPATPSRKDQFYGPNFTFKEYMRAPNWFRGMVQHFAMTLFGIMLVTPPLRRLIWRFVRQPGEGPTREDAQKDRIEYRGVANPDLEGTGKQAFCRATFQGSMYYLTGVLLAEAAMTILADDVELGGGIYTPACLGQPYIDRLDGAGFKMESKMIPK